MIAMMATACSATWRPVIVNTDGPTVIKSMEFPVEEWTIFYNWDVSGDEDKHSAWHPAHEDNEGLYNTISAAATLMGFSSKRLEKFVKEDATRDRYILIVFSRENLERNAVTFVVKNGSKANIFEFSKKAGDDWFNFYSRAFKGIRKKIPADEPEVTTPGADLSVKGETIVTKGETIVEARTEEGDDDESEPTPPPESDTSARQGVLKPDLVGEDGTLSNVGSSKIHDILDKNVLATAKIQIGEADRGKQKFPKGTVAVLTKTTNKTFVIDKALGENDEEIAVPKKLKGKRMWLFSGDTILETVPKVS
jgi:hypothetical protein